MQLEYEHRYSAGLIPNDSQESIPNAGNQGAGNRQESPQNYAIANPVDNFRTNVILAPIESSRSGLSIGTGITLVRKLSDAFVTRYIFVIFGNR